MERKPNVGGWSPGRLQLSLFIRDYLVDQGNSWAHAIYRAYTMAAEAIPKHRGKGPRKTANYHSFLNYMYILRQLELIELVSEEPRPTEDRAGQPNPQLSRRRYYRAAPGRLGDPAWNNPRKALYG